MKPKANGSNKRQQGQKTPKNRRKSNNVRRKMKSKGIKNQVWKFLQKQKQRLENSRFYHACPLPFDKTHSALAFCWPFFRVLHQFKVLNIMELFISICDNYKIPAETSSAWLDNIKQHYSAEKRHFHNIELIEKKLNLVREIIGDDGSKDALVLAIIFQYFHYDVKRDLKKENCDEFRLFIDQAGIKDVSWNLLQFYHLLVRFWDNFRKFSWLMCSRCFRTKQRKHRKLQHLKKTCLMTLIWLFWGEGKSDFSNFPWLIL